MQPGSRFAHFEVLGLIGTGGMGEVYRAKSARLGWNLAIKLLPMFVAFAWFALQSLWSITGVSHGQ
jgi:hypothetical protein